MSIHELFYPRGLAIVGSVSTGRLGHELLRQILDGGYENVSVVNPKAEGAMFVPAYDSVIKVPSPVDLAVIVSPTETVGRVLEDCGQAGVRAAIIVTAGFSEVGNVEGAQEIERIAERHGIRFVGPNCAGIFNAHHQLFPTLEMRPPLGGVSLIAQSGAVGGVVLSWGREYDLGFSKFVSYGNAADLNEIDFLRFLTDDEQTKVVALYLETVADGRGFMAAVQACGKRKPVVVLKAGRTRAGQRATLSHTGSMAGSDAVYDAALRQCGAIRVRSMEEMFDLCMGFTRLPPLHGRKVLIVTNSGGPGVLTADCADDMGLDVAEPSRDMQQELSEFLPAHCPLNNPIDLTVEGTEDGYRRTLATVLPEYDAALALNIAPPYLDSVSLARGIADAAGETGKPVLASFRPGSIVAEGIAELQRRQVPDFASGERAAATLAYMSRYEAGKAALRPLPKVPSEHGQARAVGPMLEPEAMRWLRDNGIPIPAFRCATSSAGAVEACRQIGYPVVMKVVSPDIVHKSDAGGVALGIDSDEAARRAFADIQQAATGKDFRGVVIYPMVHDAQEMLVGLSRDQQFGPVLACGYGGIHTELWHDISLRVAPVDLEEARAMLRELRCFPLLAGIRGQAAADLEALVDLLVRVSRLSFRYPDIDEVDLNPVFVFSHGLLVGDVRVIRRTPTGKVAHT